MMLKVEKGQLKRAALIRRSTEKTKQHEPQNEMKQNEKTPKQEKPQTRAVLRLQKLHAIDWIF